MNDIERFALNVEYTTGKKRGRHPVFSSSQFYPYAAERRLQNSLRNELERYMAEAFGAATAGENFVTDTLEDLSRLPDEISEDMKNEIAYASDAVARKVSSSIAEMTEMTIGKPYYPPAAKQEILTSWEANFQTLCKSAKSDMKKEMSMIVQQAKNEGWNGKQLEREIRNRLPEKYAGRAKNIARTETGKLNTAITLSTYKEIGIQYYVWMATMDERTRPDHAMMNDLICSATDPEVWYEENKEDPLHPIEHKRDGTMVHLHPGEDFQCRCTMVMWDPVIDGKYEVKEGEKPEEPEERAENGSESPELEKANERLAEKEKELERAENERKTVEKELAQEKSERKAAEEAQKNAEEQAEKQKAENERLREEKANVEKAKIDAEKLVAEQKSENAALRAKNAEAEQLAAEAEKRAESSEKIRKTEGRTAARLAEKELKEAVRYRGLTNDPGLNKAIAETESAVEEYKNGGLVSTVLEKIVSIKEKLFGLKTEEEIMDSFGAKRFTSHKTPIQVVRGTNPTGSDVNCPACAAIFELRCRGWNVHAKEFLKRMFHVDPSLYYKKPIKIRFSNYEEIEKKMIDSGEGARFSICVDLLKDGKVKSHVISSVIMDGRVTYIDSQINEYEVVDYFRKYSLIGSDNFIFRTDNLVFKPSSLRDLLE